MFKAEKGELFLPIERGSPYLVSNFGRVYSCTRRNKLGSLRKGRMIAQHINTKGYWSATIKNYSETKKEVHRLVADLFVKGKFKGAIVNHIDGDKLNNKAKNLEWVSHQENINHAWENKLMRPDKNKKPIVLYNDKEILYFDSQTDAAKYLGVTISGVSGALHKYGRQRRVKGLNMVRATMLFLLKVV